MQKLSKASIRHVLIKKEIRILVRYVTKKSHYVTVADSPQSLNLRRESMIAPPGPTANESFNRDVYVVWH
nr:hypothetical protein [Arabidopsis thaliana]